MMLRSLVAAAAIAVAAAFILRPAPRAPLVAVTAAPALAAESAPSHVRRERRAGDGFVVYVVGAVRRAGLYRLQPGDRYDRAVALAGGFGARADTAAVNLAQRAADGDEIVVPRIGDAPPRERGTRHGRRHAASPPPEGSVDLNSAGAAQLARIPGIGRAIAARIVELREREGNFASLDELLDVAGMTQSRLERARSYFREI